MAKRIKRQPPSRIRYEQSHPIVSCRVSLEIFDRLVEAKEVEDKSFADILKIGLGKQEVQAKKILEAKTKGEDEGYKKGYAAAELRYKVTYNCSKCGQAIEVTNEAVKKAISGYMQDKGWAHKECPQPKP
jgi:predicted CopG family antitoxin